MKRRTLLGGTTTVLLLGARELAFGAEILAVRMWPAQDYTRITLESDAALTARHSLLDNPPRLLIDIDGLDFTPLLGELLGRVRADDPYVASVRAGQNQPRVVRVVVDLKQAVAPQVFALAPVAAYRNRLVFDLYPVHEADPLLALVREKEAAERQAARDVQDALGEFIDQMGKTMPPHATPPHATPPAPAIPPVATAPSPPGPARPASPLAPPLPPGLANRVSRLVIIALDPGHGGEDPGAVGPTGLREKDVVLEVALKLRERLNGQPNVRVMLTRDADFFVPLAERVRKAQRVQADLFVSIHADAFIRPEARGASVFALSDRGASSSAARWMARRENAADLVGGANKAAARDQQVVRALADMSTAAQIKDSLKLGGEVLGQIGRVGRLHKGSVEQASFAVLKAPDIPSILVETAFISNPDEEARLRDPEYHERLVQALAAGIRRYFARNPPLARRRIL